jgi:sulfopyruvate decarboxylase subunit alpha
MKESAAKTVVEGLKEADINFIVCLPESLLNPLYRMLMEDDFFKFISVTNEGEGAAVAAGLWLGGKKAILVMENSGLRVAAEPLARMGITFGIPVLMAMCHRGDIGETNSWGIAHNKTMEPILQAMNIPYTIVRNEEEIKSVIKRSIRHITTSLYHIAIVFSGDTMEANY